MIKSLAFDDGFPFEEENIEEKSKNSTPDQAKVIHAFDDMEDGTGITHRITKDGGLKIIEK